MTAARVGVDAARWITAAVRSPGWFGPSRRRRRISGPSVPDIPCWRDGDVDLNVVDDNDCGSREELAGRDGMDPRARFLPFIHVTFVLILEP